MTRLPSLSDQDIISALLKAGFVHAPHRGKGSHTALYKVDEKGVTHLAIIPKRKIMPKGTLSAILKQTGLSREELIKLTKK